MKRILILPMLHTTDDAIFVNYKNIWNKQIENINDNIKVLFLTGDTSINSDYIIRNDYLISNCIEDYWQSLLTRMLNGLKYFVESDFDFVFKTNISTIINYKLFNDYCQNRNDDTYIYDGIYAEYHDFLFCSGAGFLLNKKSANLILNNLDKLNDKPALSPSWTDDIFVGYVLNKIHKICPNNNLNRLDILDSVNIDETINNYTHIRIKIRKGDDDIRYTNLVYNLLKIK